MLPGMYSRSSISHRKVQYISCTCNFKDNRGYQNKDNAMTKGLDDEWVESYTVAISFFSRLDAEFSELMVQIELS